MPRDDATYIEMDWNTYDAKLVYNDTAFVNTKCCYSEILRDGSGESADEKFKYAHSGWRPMISIRTFVFVNNDR